MEYSPAILARLLFEAILLGGSLGLFYSILDFFKILSSGSTQTAVRKHLASRKLPLLGILSMREKRFGEPLFRLFVFLEDVAFCLSASVGILLLAYIGNEGRIRWFLPLGTLLGFLLFRYTVGKWISHFFEYVSLILYVLLRYILFFVFIPFKTIYRIIRSFILWVLSDIARRIAVRRELRFRVNEKERLLRAAQNGFGCAAILGMSEEADSTK